MKERVDHGKAARSEQSPANPLNEPGGNKQLNRRGRRAQRGGGYEDRRPQGEHAASAIDVAERTGGQDKRREREYVTVQRPLQPRGVRVQITADRRQRHVDDGRLQQHHRLTQHRHRQHPAAGSRSQPHRTGPAAVIPHQLHPSRRSSLPYDPKAADYEPGHEEKVIAQPSHGGLNAPSWFMIAAMSSAAHSSLIRPSRMR